MSKPRETFEKDSELKKACFKTNTFDLLYALHFTLNDKYPNIHACQTESANFETMARKYHDNTDGELLVSNLFLVAQGYGV